MKKTRAIGAGSYICAPHWIIKGPEIHVCYRTSKGENPRKSVSHSQDRDGQLEVD